MKLLKTDISRMTLYENNLEIDFTTSQRVTSDAIYELNQITDNVYANPVIELAGINASGKTMTLKVIKLVISLLNGMNLNSLSEKELFLELIGDEPVVLKMYYFWEGNFYFLKTKIGRRKSKRNPMDEELWICEESLYKSKPKAKITKNNWIRQPGEENSIYELVPFADREKASDFLPDDVSVNVAMVNKNREPLTCCDFLGMVNHNYMKVFGEYIPDILHLLDPNIEYLKMERNEEGNRFRWLLKFKNRSSVFSLNSPEDLELYLSSGTIKGIGIFSMSIAMFYAGGYILVDELENHFNLQIVKCLLDLFVSRTTNRNGATILFSTHYPGLLDIPSRNDAVYILSNNEKISCKNLSVLKKRNDGRKPSKAFAENLLNVTTAPSYQAFIKLKELIENIESVDRIDITEEENAG